MDSVSTMGYGLGYIGGSTIPLVIFLVMNAVGVPMLTCLAVIFAITAVWWLVFSLPLLKNCRQTSGKPYEKGDVGRNLRGVFATMREIWHNKPMLVYIVAYFFYIDGVHTIISMATSYGTNLGLDSAGMLLALLLVQVLGLPFCLLYMKLAARFGARRMVGVGHLRLYVHLCVRLLYGQPVAVLDAGGALRHQPGRHPGAVPFHVRPPDPRPGPQRRILRLL